MNEIKDAVRTIRNLPANCLIQTNGYFHFVGRVDIRLCYVQIDGAPLTQKQIDGVKHCGPGLFKATIKSRTFATREEALQAVAELTE